MRIKVKVGKVGDRRLVVLNEQDLIEATGWSNLNSSNIKDPGVQTYIRQYLRRKLRCNVVHKIRVFPLTMNAVILAGLY